ncbi:hypothetical protein KRP22_001106 [Phytophthora ramorum]|nr:hypothetical protein KRP22_157 [Phytophthora ramorum]
MTAKKSAPRRKCTAPAPLGAKKKTVAAKKKHVRELAKAGRWAEIGRFYGEKILDKAKAYSAKSRVVKTPQEIAHEILLKNGYLPSVPQQAAAPVATVNRSLGSTIRVGVPARNNTEPHSSPETLTKEQHELIEKRRRDALERRKHAQLATGVKRVQPSVVPMDHVANAAKTFQDGLQSSVAPESELRHRRLQPPPQTIELTRQTMQSRDQTRRIVTPEHLPTTNSGVEAEHVRPEYFWDDLEAAAEIVQWEHEHMAEAALEQIPPKTPRGFDGTIQKASGRQMLRDEGSTRSRGVSSLSQELAAAAEIIQWEKEHEVSPEAPALPHSNADFNKAANLGGGNSPSSSSSCPAQAKRGPTAEFM